MKKLLIGTLVLTFLFFAYFTYAKPPIEGVYDLYEEGHSEKGLVTRMVIFDARGIYFSVRGIDQDWSGDGWSDGSKGYYLWEFTNGDSGITDFTIDENGVIRGYVQGDDADWVAWTYLAYPSKKTAE